LLLENYGQSSPVPTVLAPMLDVTSYYTNKTVFSNIARQCFFQHGPRWLPATMGRFTSSV